MKSAIMQGRYHLHRPPSLQLGGLHLRAGTLTLVAGQPGAGKTSWLLNISADAVESGHRAAFACYEHTVDEMAQRLHLQARAIAAEDAHREADEATVAQTLASWQGLVLVELDYETDTVRALEDHLIRQYRFPQAPSPDECPLVVVDYLQRIPVTTIGGLVREETRAGEAAAALRAMARRRGWAVVAISALDAKSFTSDTHSLADLLGDERVAYESDVVVVITTANRFSCGCNAWTVEFLKDRFAPAPRYQQMYYWGERYYASLSPCSRQRSNR